MDDLTKLYILIGTLVVTNISGIFAVIYAAAKLIWWLSAFKTSTESGIAQNTKDLNGAFNKIRDLENHLRDS